jgi:hypothetical protein
VVTFSGTRVGVAYVIRVFAARIKNALSDIGPTLDDEFTELFGKRKRDCHPEPLSLKAFRDIDESMAERLA